MNSLAIDGGAPVRTRPFSPWPIYAEQDVDVVSAVLMSGQVNYWTGNIGRDFEAAFAARTGVTHALTLSNGTVALHGALAALGIQPGDEVIVPARTFVATANAVLLAGGTPVFADIDLHSQCLTAESIRSVLSTSTRVVIVVHLAGWPADMDPILELAADRELSVIEDCAQALGATYRGRQVGSMGDIGTFSFCQDKIASTGGEGGMLTTSSDDIWQTVWGMRDHGKSFERCHAEDTGQWGVEFKWLHETVGTNWRMTEMQSALGLRALDQLDAWLVQRRTNAAVLDEGFGSIEGLRVTVPLTLEDHAYYKYYTFLDLDRLKDGWSRNRVAAAVVAEGVPCFSGTCPEVYRENSFISAGLSPDAPLPNASRLGDTSLMFLVHPTLDARDMHDTVAAVSKVMREAVT